MLTFSGTSRVSPLTEVLWDRPIRGPDGWYRTSPRACKVPSVTSPDSLRAILMNRRTSWRSDSSSGIDGCTFRNLLEKKMEIFDIQIYWKSLAYMYYSWEYSKNCFNHSGSKVILIILIWQSPKSYTCIEKWDCIYSGCVFDSHGVSHELQYQ